MGKLTGEFARKYNALHGLDMEKYRTEEKTPDEKGNSRLTEVSKRKYLNSKGQDKTCHKPNTRNQLI